jgi:hypothetical protein
MIRILASAALLGLAGAAQAGLVLEVVDKDLAKGTETLQSRSYIQSGSVRTESL